ncbi:hypothetical protein BT96DRAFT_221598 [Gymnopus androsaceus JB14]|uniref:Rhodopsin domain-containing protein n=1 Tax=Gymnopus androsaceus JB14 TaxID=1447944 RepID=A0A6A4I9N4_9AGAR|nr:hypothetical protein BT96DRAFT_221598 [Gymnopus androsaceus JB14]
MSSTTNLVFNVTFFTISSGSTIARLWIRYRRQRLWWDDGWAILTMILSTLVDISLFGSGSNPLIPFSPQVEIVQFWVGLICFTLAVWCARISLMLSIIRLIPPLFTLRRISEWAVVSFSLICVGILTPKIYVCASYQSWRDMLDSQCNLRLKLAIGELITDLVADITLVVIPIRLLGYVNLPKDKWRMLIVIFGASLLTSAMSVVHSVFLVDSVSHSYDHFIIPIAAELELGTALTVANLGVLTPFLTRLLGKHDGDIDSKPYTHYPSIQTNGDIRMRRVSDLVASGIRLTDTGRVSTSVRVQEPDPPGPKRKHEDLMVLGSPLSSDSNAGPLDGMDCYEIPKSKLLQGNSMQQVL